MGRLIYTNNASTTLAASITNSATTITVVDGSSFDVPLYGSYQLLTLDDGTNIEIVKLTARSGETLTVERGKESTSARGWDAGTLIECRITAWALSYTLLQNETSAYCALAVGDATVTSATDYSVSIGFHASATGMSDVVIGHSAAATSENAVAIGNSATAGWHSVAIGNAASAPLSGNVVVGNSAASTSYWSTAIGQGANTSGGNGTAIGVGAGCSGGEAISLGSNARANIARTAAISGPIIIRKDDGIGATDVNLYLTGAEVVYTSKEIDLKTTQTITIDIPTGAKFYPDEVGVIVTTVASPSGQPSLSFGVTGSNASLLAATATTKNAQFGRDRYTSLLSGDGVQSLTATVTAGATGTTFSGRAYFKGILVEVQ